MKEGEFLIVDLDKPSEKKIPTTIQIKTKKK